MTTDLRELLKEAKVELEWAGNKFAADFDDVLKRIDAALSEPAPEPYYECKICGEQVLFRRMVAKQITPTEKIETGPYCKRCQQELLYPASPSDARDAARRRDAILNLIDECPGLTMDQDRWLSQRVCDVFAAIERDEKRDPLRGTPSADFPEGE